MEYGAGIVGGLAIAMRLDKLAKKLEKLMK